MMIRRTASTALLIIALLLGCADIASATPHHRAPNRSELALLAQVKHIDPHGACHLEWDGVWVKGTHHRRGHWVDAYYEVICAR